jgi:hypothetical protein
MPGHPRIGIVTRSTAAIEPSAVHRLTDTGAAHPKNAGQNLFQKVLSIHGFFVKLTASKARKPRQNRKTARMKNAYETHPKQTREMLSVFLSKLGRNTMAADVLKAQTTDLPVYASIILRDIKNETHFKVFGRFRLMGLI